MDINMTRNEKTHNQKPPTMQETAYRQRSLCVLLNIYCKTTRFLCNKHTKVLCDVRWLCIKIHTIWGCWCCITCLVSIIQPLSTVLPPATLSSAHLILMTSTVDLILYSYTINTDYPKLPHAFLVRVQLCQGSFYGTSLNEDLSTTHHEH